jgi:hypothetical protein
MKPASGRGVGEKDVAAAQELWSWRMRELRRHRAADRVAACLLALGVLVLVGLAAAGGLGHPPPFWSQATWWVFWPAAWSLLAWWRDRPPRRLP